MAVILEGTRYTYKVAGNKVTCNRTPEEVKSCKYHPLSKWCIRVAIKNVDDAPRLSPLCENLTVSDHCGLCVRC